MAARLSALSAGRPLPPGRFLVLISVRGWVDSRAIVRLEGLGELNNPVTSSRIEPATFWLVALYLNQLTLPRAPVHMCTKTFTQFRWVCYTEIFSMSNVKNTHFIYNSVTFPPIGIDPRFLAVRFERLPFHLSTDDRMLSCDTGCHTFADLCCGNSRDWNGSLWLLVYTVL
jgi:hypothetical protein